MYKFLLFSALCLFSFNANALDTSAYDNCYAKAKTDDELSLCMKSETARLNNLIKDEYKYIIKHPELKKWNKSDTLNSGNLKDMYSHWMNYRNRYCSLYKVASKNSFGSPDFHYERCMLTITHDHYELLESVLVNVNTSGEEDD
ncbi:MAG: DUF1311 domain-containing protein [Alphaproteobacteria bacterium]|nr:DUF1311 domain-containing protein [Alphaproteobacteria bacterium]